MSNHEPTPSIGEPDGAASVEPLSFADDYALGFECAEPALQIEGWGQGDAALH